MTFNIEHNDLKLHLHTYLHENELPDNPVSLLSIDSPYLDVSQVASKLPINTIYSNKALHININSIPDKIELLKELLSQFQDNKIQFDFILLCETYLRDNIEHLFNIPGYKLVTRNRQVSKGGVAIYVRDYIPFKVRSDLSLFYEGEFETVFIETKYQNKPNCLVGEIYRIPGTSESTSLDRFESILIKLDQTSLNVIIGTDQNFDYLKIATHERTAELFNLFVGNDLIPTATKPTRITPDSATLIDNIYVRQNSPCIFSAVIPYKISDHFPVLCFTGRHKPKARFPLARFRPRFHRHAG